MTRQTVAAVLAEAAAKLAGVSDTPRLDAELLMAHALGIERSTLLLTARNLNGPDSFDALVARRLAHEPVAYIVGHRDFWTIRLAVGPGALIPRADSETLIEAALGVFRDRAPPRRILDLGTGPGTLLLAALSEWPDATGVGVDASEAALGWARQNGRELGMADRVQWLRVDWTHDAWDADLSAPFDLILANPPYIEADAALDPMVRDHEPANALFAGADGLDAYRVLIPQLRALLAESGIVVMEIGAGQAAAVTHLSEKAGFSVVPRIDLGGHIRALTLT